MTKILVRSGKNPLTPVGPEASLARNGWGVFGANNGNLLYQISAFRSVSVPGAEVISDSLLVELGDANDEFIERANAEFDLYVVPLANAFRGSFVRSLNRLSSTIERLRIPVVVLGVGIQKLESDDFSAVPPKVLDASRRFVAAVLERSASIGVRGEITRDYLVHLGFPAEAVDAIGCPSIYLNGPGHTVTKRVERLSETSNIALNVTPSKVAFADMIDRSAAAYPNLTYLPQEHVDLAMMLWGEERDTRTDPRMPTHTGHRLYTENRMRFFLDAHPWIEYLRRQDFAFGTRLHGNIAALLAGTPAYVVAHDSRTKELADFHAIPHRMLADLDGDVTAGQLYDEADYDAFNRRYPETFRGYRDFLDRNGVPHVFGDEDGTPAEAGAVAELGAAAGAGAGAVVELGAAAGAAAFDRALAAVDYPPAVEVIGGGDPALADVRARLRWLRQGAGTDKYRTVGGYQPEYVPAGRDGAGAQSSAGAGLDAAVAELTEQVAALNKRARAAQKEIAQLKDQQRADKARIADLERGRPVVRALGAVRRRVGGRKKR